MSKDILYGIKYVELEELDPITQIPPTANPKVYVIDTAETAELESVVSEGEEELKRNDSKILAIVRTPDLLYGYDVTLTDNTFDPEIMALIEGGTLVKEIDEIIGYDSPMLSQGSANMKQFRMHIYVANYVGDSIENYVKITLNNCTGSAPNMSVGKEFYAPEFSIKAREATKAGLPIKGITYVDVLPTAVVIPPEG